MDRTHNPEFTVLEIYEAYGDRSSMKAIIEGLLPHLCEKVLGTMKVEYGEAKEVLDFTPPYREVAYRDIVREVMGADWFDLPVAEARARVEARGVSVDPAWSHLLVTHEAYGKLSRRRCASRPS
jgi:lysyl-tRNA synthetase class 2